VERLPRDGDRGACGRKMGRKPWEYAENPRVFMDGKWEKPMDKILIVNGISLTIDQ